MKNPLAAAVAAALIVCAPAALAEVRFSGFGQVIAGATTAEDEFVPSTGYDDEVTFSEESRFAIQVDADLNDRVSVTGQVLANGNEDFDAELAWAYANIRLGSGWSMKVGRQRTPFYRYSDVLDVGYAYPWIRPPASMYNQPWSNNDGISLTHSAFAGDWYSQLQLVYGDFDGETRLDGAPVQAELSRITGATWDVEYSDWLSLRAAHLRGDLTIEGTSLDDLAAGLRMYGEAALASELDFADDTGIFTNFGFRIDRANWLVNGEYTLIDVENSLLDGNNRRDWYLSVARRFDTVTPHLTYGRRDIDRRSELATALPEAHPLQPIVAEVVATEQADEYYLGLGVRWDFAPNVAFKADWTRYDSRIAQHGDADLVSAGLVFTF